MRVRRHLFALSARHRAKCGQPADDVVLPFDMRAWPVRLTAGDMDVVSGGATLAGRLLGAGGADRPFEQPCRQARWALERGGERPPTRAQGRGTG